MDVIRQPAIRLLQITQCSVVQENGVNKDNPESAWGLALSVAFAMTFVNVSPQRLRQNLIGRWSYVNRKFSTGYLL